MEKKKIIKREIEEEVTEKMLCDNCNKEIEHPGACGFGADYHLSDKWCFGCGGKSWDFCDIKCLSEFIKNKLEKDALPKQSEQEGKK